MKIVEIQLHTIKSGDTSARSAAHGESQYWGGGWQAQNLISNPMFVQPKYPRVRSLWMGGITSGRWIAAMAKPYDMPDIPHGASVYNYHFVMANANLPYAEYLSVGKREDIQPIFSVLEGEPLPVNGKVSLDSNKPGFGVELKRELLTPFKG
jgi:L-alanine-DL-glutamate epimerase-like enolase superfamily enzyme